jgi:hypothetical protein
VERAFFKRVIRKTIIFELSLSLSLSLRSMPEVEVDNNNEKPSEINRFQFLNLFLYIIIRDQISYYASSQFL